MKHFYATREFYIPSGSTKVADKQSDAIAYVYERNGHPCAMVFYGKQAKPVWSYRFRSTEERERRVREAFSNRKAWNDRNATRRQERNAETHNLQIGHILKSSWGYDQTNVDFYQVTKIVSPKMVELRKIASTFGKALSAMSQTVFPVADQFLSEPMRKRAGRGGIKIADYAYAYLWDGRAAYSSDYH